LVGLAAIVAVVLAPRAARACQALWLAAPAPRNGPPPGLVGAVALFLATLFAALLLQAAMDFLGLGVQPPIPSLGAMLADGMTTLAISPAGVLAPGLALWLCAFGLFVAADALVGYFSRKDVVARLNE
jgi:hypothetical protein